MGTIDKTHTVSLQTGACTAHVLVTFTQGHAAVGRMVPNDVPWEALSQKTQ